MDEALKKHLSGKAKWTRPDGGYFFWLELPQDIDAKKLRANSFDHGIGFQPGEDFSSAGEFKNYIRLSFAHYGEDKIRGGVGRLAECINQYLAQTLKKTKQNFDGPHKRNKIW
jgi:DNA-binding transcriptional MocR family regulator